MMKLGKGVILCRVPLPSSQVSDVAKLCSVHLSKKIKSLLYSLNFAERVTRVRGLSLLQFNTASFQEVQWRALGNTCYDLIGLRYEPQTSHSRNERDICLIARYTVRTRTTASVENFSREPIGIEPALTTKNGRIFEIWKV